MARVFTSIFVFEGKDYMAVITQTDGAINIFVPNERLHPLLPRGKYSYDPERGLKIDTPKLRPVQRLLLAILSATELQEELKISAYSRESGV